MKGLRARRGFALLTALWLMVAIAVVSLELSLRARQRHLGVANATERVQAAAAADAGVEHAHAVLHRMLDQGDRRRWSDPAALRDPWRNSAGGGVVPDTVAIGHGRYVVAASDPGTALHLNTATEAEIQRLLQALPGRPIDAVVARRLAERLVDWRDRDAIRRPLGAERDDYLAAGARDLPTNADFMSVDEVRSVSGMDQALFDRLRGYVTVHGVGQVNVNVAPRPVLLAMPGVTEPIATVIERAQWSGRSIASLQELLDLLPVASRLPLERESAALVRRLAFETREMHVRSTGWVDGSPVRVVSEATYARAGNAMIRTWGRSD